MSKKFDFYNFATISNIGQTVPHIVYQSRENTQIHAKGMMAMVKKLGIDPGRFSTVTIGENGYIDKFPSWTGEARTINLENERRPTDIVLQTGFGSFFIGDLAKDESHSGARFMIESKIHNDTKALVLAAAARALEDGDQAEIVTGVPKKLHTTSVKEELVKLLIGKHTVVLNGEHMNFEICKVGVAVEGISAHTLLSKDRNHGMIRYLDLGSRMINGGTMRNGRRVDKESFSFEWGCDTLGVGGNALGRAVVSELSQKWSDFSPPTWVFGGGLRKCGNFIAQHFPRMLWCAQPDYVMAQTFFLLAGGEMPTYGGQ